jgi:hypothetical protein
MLDWFAGVASPAAAATRYITVFDGDPTSGGTEVINTLNGSANRIDMTTGMGAAASGSIANDAIITITSSAVAAADVDYVAIYDSITGGTLWGYAAVTAKGVGIGDSLTIPIGNLTIVLN